MVAPQGAGGALAVRFQVHRIVMKCRGLSVTGVRDVLSSRAHWEDMKSGMRCGMTFTNGRVGIVVPRADLPRQDFEINF